MVVHTGGQRLYALTSEFGLQHSTSLFGDKWGLGGVPSLAERMFRIYSARLTIRLFNFCDFLAGKMANLPL